MRRVVLAALVVAAIAFVGDAIPAKAANKSVGIVNYGFKAGACPAPGGDNQLSIMTGDTVTWTNCTAGPTATEHTVTGNGGSFGDEHHIAAGDTFSHTFNTVGTFPYHCAIHPSSMTGIVNVSEETTTTVTEPPTTTPTTAKPTTTTTSTSIKPTTTTVDVNGVFAQESTTSTTPTTIFTTDTTRALGAGGDSGSSGGVIALLAVALVGVGTGAFLVVRRMRAGAPPS